MTKGTTFTTTILKGRRDKLHVIAEILEIARDGALKTQIMYRANLSFTQLNDFLKFMIRNKLIEKMLITGKEVYKATERGLDFLQRYREITELMFREEESVELEQEISEVVQIEHKKESKGESPK